MDISGILQKKDMLRAGDICIAAVSGGADSTALLLCLEEASARIGFALTAMHVNHGIRGSEADRDETFVRELCECRGISFTAAHVDAPLYAEEEKLTLEEAARLLRYRVLNEEAVRLEAAAPEGVRVRIAVAHNSDDQAETVLMQLIRGSGLKGVSGMQPVRDRIIRPLLYVSRKEIEEYLGSVGQEYVTDSTNFETEYTRNRIRADVMPVLKEINPAASANIRRAAEAAGDADRFISEAADRCYREASVETGRGPGLSVSVLERQDKIIREYMVRRAIGEASGRLKDIGAVHAEEVLGLMKLPSGRGVDLPYGIRCVREYDLLVFTDCRSGSAAPDGRCDTAMPDGRLEMREFEYGGEAYPTETYKKWFSADRIQDKAVFRTPEPGDYIELKGGGHKNLRDLMTDLKIPPLRRNSMPLLADGHHVMWLAGYRISEYYKVDRDTLRVLEAVYIPQSIFKEKNDGKSQDTYFGRRGQSEDRGARRQDQQGL